MSNQTTYAALVLIFGVIIALIGNVTYSKGDTDSGSVLIVLGSLLIVLAVVLLV
jgi:hypothetical protein